MIQTQFYQSSLALVHHQAYDQIAQNAAQILLSFLQKQGLEACQILDLGCGSGTLSKILSEKTHQVLGIDFSEDMIILAKKNAPLARFQCISIFDFEFVPSDVICSVGECLNYLFDQKSNDENLQKIFQKAHQSLPKGGIFLFDLLCLEYLDQNFPIKNFQDTPEWTILVQASIENQILERQIILFTNKGNFHQKTVEIHRQRLYDKEKIKIMLEKIGFSVKILDKYHDLSLRKGHFGFWCQKL